SSGRENCRRVTGARLGSARTARSDRTNPLFQRKKRTSRYPDRFPENSLPFGCAGAKDAHSSPACVRALPTQQKPCSRLGGRKVHRAGFVDNTWGKTKHCISSTRNR